MSKFKDYRKYKKSGIPWLEVVPEHWDIKKAKWIFLKHNRPVQIADDVITAFRDGQVTLRKNRRADGYTIATKEHGYQGIRKGDLVIHGMDAFAGAIGVSDSNGKSSPVYNVCTLQIEGDIWYFCWIVRQMSKSGYIECLAKGIRERSTDFRFDIFSKQLIPIPSSEEQRKIVQFLNFKLSKINRFITKKKKVLLLNAERRKSFTRDIINKRPVQYLRISSVAKFAERQIERIDNEIYTPIGLYNRGRGIFHKEQTLGKDLGDSTFYYIKKGDVVLSGQFAWEGAVALASLADENCIASHRYPVLNCDLDIIKPEYLYSYFTISEGFLLLGLHSRGAAGRNRPLNPRRLVKEKIPIPAIELQEKLAEIYHNEVKLKATVLNEIKIVEEYKTALIAEAVTGKIDVRDFEIPKSTDEESYEDLEEELSIAAESRDEYLSPMV